VIVEQQGRGVTDANDKMMIVFIMIIVLRVCMLNMRTYCEAIVFNQSKFSVVFEIMRVMMKIYGRKR
jgi:hypothetical protein